MDIREASKKLKLSQRHLRRLIKTGALPAKRVKKMIEVVAWDIDDDTVDAITGTIGAKIRRDFVVWMLEQMKALDLTSQELSKRSRTSIREILIHPERWDALENEDSETKEKVVAAIIRAAIEKRQMKK